MEAAFTEVKPKLDRVVSRFARERGGHADDLHSIAYEAFVDAESCWAFDTTDPGWTTYLCNRAWWRLLDHARRERTATGRLGMVPDPLPDRGPGRIESLLAELGDDARAVCRLVLESPAELAEVLGAGEPWACRKALRGWLAGLGWTAEQAVAAFAEIRGALQ